jgi:hypothetical protein
MTSMTLVTMPRCFDGYELDRLPEVFLAVIRRDPRLAVRVNPMAIRLQAFCELTKQSLAGSSVDQCVSVLEDFSAAYFSAKFLQPTERTVPWHQLSILKRLLPSEHAFRFPCNQNRKNWPLTFAERVRYYDRVRFDCEQEEFWTGWVVESATGRKSGLNLHGFWKHFGPAPTRELFAACRTWFSKGRADSVPVVDQFAKHLQCSPPISFSDPSSLGRAISEFLPVYFRSGVDSGSRLHGLVARWRAFAELLTDHLLGADWATPIPAIPLPSAPGRNRPTRLVQTEDGVTVHHALITPVPLSASDTEAKELLFRDIRRDADTLLEWGRHEVRQARERLNARKEFAGAGLVSEASRPGTNNGLRFRTSRDCPEWFAHASATFEANGLAHLDSHRSAWHSYPEPMSTTAWDLGLPTPTLLLAHASVLVRRHPIVTPSFLSNLDLFDQDGKQIGLVGTDAGWYLRGAKFRNGPLLAQQQVLLDQETLQVVRDIIELTTPLRWWLRSHDNPIWRRLFLVMASMGCPPSRWYPDREASHHIEWLTARFVSFASTTGMTWLAKEEDARDLAKRFSLKKLRSSSGVLVYLETGSVEQMAKALGHADWRPTLLDRYLPRPIQEFFTERWIRLFQNGIVCEALKDSPYLLQASGFSSMAELDAFLEHHALKRIPAHLTDPDNIGGKRVAKHDDRFVFGIESGVLSILMSIEAAVRKAQRVPCGRAIRWARVSERLVPHLETQIEQPEFYSVVAAARRHADAARVEAIIYG